MEFILKMEFFQLLGKNGRPFGLPFLKFTTRVLKKMPLINRGLPQVQTRDSLGSWIEAELRFLRDVVQPALGASRSALKIKSRWAKINWHIYGKIEKLSKSSYS